MIEQYNNFLDNLSGAEQVVFFSMATVITILLLGTIRACVNAGKKPPRPKKAKPWEKYEWEVVKFDRAQEHPTRVFFDKLWGRVRIIDGDYKESVRIRKFNQRHIRRAKKRLAREYELIKSETTEREEPVNSGHVWIGQEYYKRPLTKGELVSVGTNSGSALIGRHCESCAQKDQRIRELEFRCGEKDAQMVLERGGHMQELERCHGKVRELEDKLSAISVGDKDKPLPCPRTGADDIAGHIKRVLGEGDVKLEGYYIRADSYSIGQEPCTWTEDKKISIRATYYAIKQRQPHEGKTCGGCGHYSGPFYSGKCNKRSEIRIDHYSKACEHFKPK